ncbi:MAG TPA: ABC transporter permease [Thermoanaerobaculia bacterium]|nr:ABC transporter permease [Thermoanaerobaculia bacterium]
MNVASQALRAVRSLIRQPFLSGAIVLVLAVGIALNSVLFSIVRPVLLEPLPYERANDLFTLAERGGGAGNLARMSALDFIDWRSRVEKHAEVFAFRVQGFDMIGGEYPERLEGAVVSPNFFAVLRARPALGRTFSPDDGRESSPGLVVLSHDLWSRRFAGDRKAVGRTVTLSGEPFLIVGVMSRDFHPFPRVDLWSQARGPVPLPGGFFSTLSALEQAGAGRSMEYLTVVLRRSEEISTERFGALVEAVTGRDKQLVLLRDAVVENVRPGLVVLSFAVALLLLIACANAGGLLVVRVASRRREISVRLALGARRWQVGRELLIECAIIAIASGCVGILLAYTLLYTVLALVPPDVPRLSAVAIDLRVVGFTFLISLVSGLVFGATPLWSTLRAEASGSTRRTETAWLRRASRPERRLHSAMAVAQIALALVLLVWSTQLARRFVELSTIDLGFRRDGLVVAQVSSSNLSSAKNSVYQEAADRLANLPGVRSITRSSDVPLIGGQVEVPMVLEDSSGPARPEPIMTGWHVVSPGYFRQLGIPLLAGRDFSPHEDERFPRVALVSREAAKKFWGDATPIGRRISLHSPQGDRWWATVIGMVEDVRYRRIATEPSPDVYYSLPQNPQPSFYYVIRASNPDLLVREVRRTMASLLPGQPLANVKSMEELYGEALAEQRLHTVLLCAFTSIALVLAATGIYGTVSFFAARRAREFGVRTALGAARGAIFRLVVGEAFQLVGAGVAIGWLAAFLLRAPLSRLLSLAASSDAWVMAGAGALFCLVALGAVSPVAWRATRSDSMELLREQ